MAEQSKHEKRQAKIENLLNMAQEGIKDVFESEKYKNYLKVMSKFHHYSFRNNLLIASQKPDATYVAGYQAWRTKFKRQVQRGEKGIEILGYTPYHRTETVQVKDKNGNPVFDVNGEIKTEKRKVLIPAFSPVNVFDVSQTKGEPLPQLINELDGSVEAYNDLFNAIGSVSRYKVEFEDIKGGAKGYCDYLNKKIAINNGMSEVQNIKTLIHEITHADLHVPEIEQSNKKDSRTREIEAESTAFVVSNHYGIDTSDYSFGYLASWSSSRELEELQSSLETIQKQANELIDRIDEKLLELQKEKNIEIETSKDIEKEITLEHKIEEKTSFSIYQIPEGKDFRDIRFLNYKDLENQNLKPKSSNYTKVYEGNLFKNRTLEDIFVEFNTTLPTDYRGRSLSVSDVIVIDNQIKPEAYYIDDIGFVKLPSFEVQQDLNQNINHGEARRKREMLDNIVFDGEIDLDKEKEPDRNKISMEYRFKNARAEAEKRNSSIGEQEHTKEFEHQR